MFTRSFSFDERHVYEQEAKRIANGRAGNEVPVLHVACGNTKCAAIRKLIRRAGNEVPVLYVACGNTKCAAIRKLIRRAGNEVPVLYVNYKERGTTWTIKYLTRFTRWT